MTLDQFLRKNGYKNDWMVSQTGYCYSTISRARANPSETSLRVRRAVELASGGAVTQWPEVKDQPQPPNAGE
jgi:hypothetical protein